MSMVLSLLWFMMPIFLTSLWIPTIILISITGCGKRRKTEPTTPVATTPTGTSGTEIKAEPSDADLKKSSVKFTASQQAKIDAELKAALEAEKEAKEAKQAKDTAKPQKSEPAPAVTLAKGIDGPPPQSLKKPISLGMTKFVDVGKDGTPTKYEPAKREIKDAKDKKDEQKKDEGGNKKEESKKDVAKKDGSKKDTGKKDGSKKDVKKDAVKKDTQGGGAVKKDEKVGTPTTPTGGAKDDKKVSTPSKDDKKIDPKNDLPGAPLGPGKPPPKPAVVDDGRSRYVGDPANLLVSAYVKPTMQKK